MTRNLWVRLHRWLGLALAIFLLNCGLTGSLLAFRDELMEVLNPPPTVAMRDAPVLDAMTLRDRLLAQHPEWAVNWLPLAAPAPDHAHRTWISAAMPGTRLGFNAVWQDPFTGDVIRPVNPSGGLWPLTRENLMDGVYALHYHLALPGQWGERAKTLLGVAALGWLVTGFVGIAITWPRAPRGSAPRQAWWRRWAPAWRIARGAPPLRFITDVHRAGSLWLWSLMLVIAWTAVGFNLPGHLYERVMTRVFGPIEHHLPHGEGDGTPLDWPTALAHARAAMAEAATREGFTVQHEVALRHEARNHRFVYDVASDRDLNAHHGRTTLALDDHTGILLGLRLPTGQHTGVTVDHWFKSFHMARIGGLAGKVLVSALGLFVAFLAGSGVVLWWTRRRWRHVAMQR